MSKRGGDPGRVWLCRAALAWLAMLAPVACSLAFEPGDLSRGDGVPDDHGAAGAPAAGAAGGAGGAAGATAGGAGAAAGGAAGAGDVGRCGDQQLDSGEECDEGDLNGPKAACSEACTVRCDASLFPGAVVAAQDPATKHCYALITDVATFNAAALGCATAPIGRHVWLASVRTRAEHDFVRAALPLSDSTWLGLRDLDNDEVALWDWVDGSPRGFLDLEPAFWGAGEPNDKGETTGTEDGEEECAVLSKLYEFLLADSDCGRTLPYVCEYSPEPP